MDKFNSFSITHKGAKHDEVEHCQDYSTHISFENGDIIVVADGHGSSKCFRSDIGSKMAVDATESIIKYNLKKLSETIKEPENFKTVLYEIVKQIINKWFKSVAKDEEENPLQEDPRLKDTTDELIKRYNNDCDYRCHAYGTTLIVAVNSDEYWFGFQVGDGRCLVLYEDGSWKMPIPWDDGCSFNVTTSICDDDSLSSFRYWFGFGESDWSYTEYSYGVIGDTKNYNSPYKVSSRPLAIFIASDGVEDSYPTFNNNKYIINFFRNRLLELIENGYDSFKEEIDVFAKRFASHESKDDVSIAWIIADLSNKFELLEQMKRESRLHEETEKNIAKIRDADEKRAALDEAKIFTAKVMAYKSQLENKSTIIEREINELKIKKDNCEQHIETNKYEIAISESEIHEAKNKINALESKKKSLAKDKKNYCLQCLHEQKNYKDAEKKLEKYNQKFKDAEKKFDEICSHIEYDNLNYKEIKKINDNKRKNVQKCENDIVDIQKQIKCKQAESLKLKTDLEALNNDLKKQEDLFAKIKKESENADKEIEKYEQLEE